jgi:hypothetical protein
MSEEYNNESEGESTSYSVFWPACILLFGLIGATGYHVVVLYQQRNIYHQQFQAAIPTINQAKVVQDRYVALMRDLIQTSAHDQYAAVIVKDAEASGMLRVQQTADTNSASTPAAPAAAGDQSK